MRITGNSPSNNADGATDRDGADATTGEEEASSFGLSLKKREDIQPKITLFFV